MKLATRLQRQEVLAYNNVKPSRANPVSKHLQRFNRAHTQRDQKNDYDRVKSIDNPHSDVETDIRKGIQEFDEEQDERYTRETDNYYKNMEGY